MQTARRGRVRPAPAHGCGSPRAAARRRRRCRRSRARGRCRRPATAFAAAAPRRCVWSCANAPRRQRRSSQSASAMITKPIATSALCSTAGGRYAFQITIGTPRTSSDDAWPSPQVRPSRVAPPRPFVDERRRRRRGDRGRLRGGARAGSRPQHDHQRRSVGEMDEPLVETEHQRLTFGSARATIAMPATTITSALTAGSTPSTRPRPSRRRNARLCEHREQADARDREREAEAEREHEQHPECDAVQRDRREQHDERRRARQQPAGDADREQRSGARRARGW